MFVLEATSETQGACPDDYVWTVDGELVLPPVGGCDDDLCGCDRGFAGMTSHRATTTARIVDRPALDEDHYRDLLIEGLEDQGYGVIGLDLLEELVEHFIALIHALGEAFGPGTVVGRSAMSMPIRSRSTDDDPDGSAPAA